MHGDAPAAARSIAQVQRDGSRAPDFPRDACRTRFQAIGHTTSASTRRLPLLMMTRSLVPALSIRRRIVTGGVEAARAHPRA